MILVVRHQPRVPEGMLNFFSFQQNCLIFFLKPNTRGIPVQSSATLSDKGVADRINRFNQLRVLLIRVNHFSFRKIENGTIVFFDLYYRISFNKCPHPEGLSCTHISKKLRGSRALCVLG